MSNLLKYSLTWASSTKGTEGSMSKNERPVFCSESKLPWLSDKKANIKICAKHSTVSNQFYSTFWKSISDTTDTEERNGVYFHKLVLRN